ncbi:Crp/Fnr family transcriptional regulator [Methylobacterium sp. P1-11]|uniref:Crp/Fnr family transcriptional regulator n=1 Tax=Methylobacterium sp. P1-11 TaxID=2024616 RepID=UPI0011EE448E|nr:Crp/Fnr family transcriptional regulator [Methylobacterium sp. P1-11]KAA0121633.1 Crp/Fnr family transcriptional regulator [Methylobacterium sp. P1-11]
MTNGVPDAVNPFVRKLEGFTSLPEADRAALLKVSEDVQLVPAGTDLVREGDPPAGVFLILDGIACRYKLRAGGARQIMAYLVPGDACDLDVALLEFMDHSITTLSDCTVVRIAPETVRDLLHRPAVAAALRKSTLVDEATLREWLLNVGRRSAVERLAHLFCELFLRLRAVGRADENAFALPLTQQDLADTTGQSTVHVNRALQELRSRGMIELQQRRLTILDLPKLKQLAEFKSGYLHLGERRAA